MSEDVSAGRLSLEVVADTTGLKADLKAKTDALAQQLKIQIQADVKVQADKAKADLKALTRDQSVKITASAATDKARADLDAAAAGRTATIKAKADTAQARADLDAVAKTRTATIKAKADTSAISQIESIGGKVSAALGPVAMASGLITAVGAAGQLAGALVAVGAAASEAAGLAGAIPGLLLAGAQAAGSLVLGFSGIGKAVSAYSAAQQSAGTSAVQSAQQVQAAQDRVRTSAQALRNAQVGGAEQVAQAQHGLQQAVTGVADAQYNAAQSVGSALHGEQQAVIALADARYNAAQSAVTSEHSYTDALYSEQQAQIALAQAREDARQNLIQTSFDLRGAVLGEKQAALSLSEAKIRLQQTLQSAAATQNQKQQARLDLQQAQLTYDESVNKAQQAAKAKQKADKAGVEGSQQVVQAKHDEQDATFAAGQADQAVARARVEAARSIREAQYQLAQAVRQYARSQVEAARSVQAAEYQEGQAAQSLRDTQRTTSQQLVNAQIGYAEAVKAAKSPLLGTSSAQTTLNKAMAGLTPAGRALVGLITGQVIPAYKAMQKSVAGALLPGVTSGLRSALPVIGTVNRGLTGTGRVLGGVASRFGSWLGSAGVNSDLSGVMAVNTAAVGRFGDAGLHVADALRNVTVVAGPLVTDVSRWADKVAKAADSLSKSGRESGTLAAFFDQAEHSAGQLLRIGENLLGTLFHIVGAAAPSGTSLLGSLVTATDKLDKWTGSSGGQARLQQFFQNTVPVARQFGDLLVKAAKVIGQLVSGFGGGELNGLFSVLNLALKVLSTLTSLPGFGKVVQWVLLLAGTGAGLGVVASKLGAVGKGLSALTKFTGLDKLTKVLGLGDTAGGAIGGGARKLGGKIIGSKGGAIAVNSEGEAERTAATGLRGAAATAGGWLSAAGQGAASMAGQVQAAVKRAGGYLSQGVSSAATFAAGFGSKMVTAAGSAITFVGTLGKQLALGAKSLLVFLAEQATVGAAFIAENLAMAASATAAFVAENAATLGIVAVLALIVTAIVYVATHWSQVWGNIRKWTVDAWHWIYGNAISPLIGVFGPDGDIAGALDWIASHWSKIWDDIKGTAGNVWGHIQHGLDNLVGGLKTTWNGLKRIFADPVNFLIKTVYDDGIRMFWDKVVDKIGLGKLDLPYISPIKLAGGGVIPGYAPGRDTVPAMLSPGEAVLTPGAVRAIGGPSVVDSLNAAHRPPGVVSAPGHYGGGIGSVIGGILGGGWDILKAAGDLLTGNVTAFANALKPLVSTSATGDLGKLLLTLPVALVKKVATGALGLFTGGGGGGTAGTPGGSPPPPSGGALTPTVRSWFAKAVKAAGVPASWIPGLETIAFYESSYNPRAANTTAAGIAAGSPRGIMQTVIGTFLANHVPGTSNSIWDPVANIAAAIRYIARTYGNPENTPGLISLAKGHGYTAYDSGGPLKPGYTPVLNATGRDEWVLTPRAVDLLGGPRQVAALNMAGSLYATGSTQAASAVAPARAATGTHPTVNVYPAPGMSEQNIGDIAARKLGFMLG